MEKSNNHFNKSKRLNKLPQGNNFEQEKRLLMPKMMKRYEFPSRNSAQKQTLDYMQRDPNSKSMLSQYNFGGRRAEKRYSSLEADSGALAIPEIHQNDSRSKHLPSMTISMNDFSGRWPNLQLNNLTKTSYRSKVGLETTHHSSRRVVNNRIFLRGSVVDSSKTQRKFFGQKQGPARTSLSTLDRDSLSQSCQSHYDNVKKSMDTLRQTKYLDQSKTKFDQNFHLSDSIDKYFRGFARQTQILDRHKERIQIIERENELLKRKNHLAQDIYNDYGFSVENLEKKSEVELVRIKKRLLIDEKHSETAQQIQKWWREFRPSVRPKYDIFTLSKLIKNIRKLQSWWRGILQMREDKKRMRKRFRAVTQIQRFISIRRIKKKQQAMGLIQKNFDYFQALQLSIETTAQILIAFRVRQFLKRQRLERERRFEMQQAMILKRQMQESNRADSQRKKTMQRLASTNADNLVSQKTLELKREVTEVKSKKRISMAVGGKTKNNLGKNNKKGGLNNKRNLSSVSNNSISPKKTDKFLNVPMSNMNTLTSNSLSDDSGSVKDQAGKTPPESYNADITIDFAASFKNQILEQTEEGDEFSDDNLTPKTRKNQ